MRDVHLRFGIDRSTCQRSHLSLVFCECLQVIIYKGDTDLAYEISPMYRESQYVEHFHHERNHQGKGNVLLFPPASQDAERQGPVQCRERRGGLLKYYDRAAA
jgi:putative transposase